MVATGRVLGVGTVHLRGRGSGVAVDLPCAWLFDHVDVGTTVYIV